MLSLHDFDFILPPELIAQVPAPERTQSRLLLVKEQRLEHHVFHELPELLEQEVGNQPVLVVNDTKVIPARLFAQKYPSLGQVELLLCEPVSSQTQLHQDKQFTHQDKENANDKTASWQVSWRCLYRSNKPLRKGTKLLLQGHSPPDALVVENEGEGKVIISFSGKTPETFLETLSRIGHIPLPPYIERKLEQSKTQELSPTGSQLSESQNDLARYQTVYAQHQGAVAAPTAGLHFSTELLQILQQRGATILSVTLHVGPGTFAPIKTNDVATHVMHKERYHISEETATALKEAKKQGRKIVAVGTTVVRTLESATPQGANSPNPGWGETALFIYPPYRFQAVDALITNFHLPRSTLLLLISAFAGKNRILSAYQEAISQKYRFFSYGDAMLIPKPMVDL